MELDGVKPKENGEGKNHQFGIEEDEDTGVVERPFAPEATRSIDHAPGDGEDGQELPNGDVEVGFVRKPGEAHAAEECCHRKNNSAQERGLAQTERVGTREHHTLTLFFRS